MTIRNQQDSSAFMPFCILCVYKVATYWHLIPYLLCLVSHFTVGNRMSHKPVIISVASNKNLIKSQDFKISFLCYPWVLGSLLTLSYHFMYTQL